MMSDLGPRDAGFLLRAAIYLRFARTHSIRYPERGSRRAPQHFGPRCWRQSPCKVFRFQARLNPRTTASNESARLSEPSGVGSSRRN